MIERSQVVYKVLNRRNRWLMCIVCDEVGGLQPSHVPTLLIPRTAVIITIVGLLFEDRSSHKSAFVTTIKSR